MNLELLGLIRVWGGCLPCSLALTVSLHYIYICLWISLHCVGRTFWYISSWKAWNSSNWRHDWDLCCLSWYSSSAAINRKFNKLNRHLVEALALAKANNICQATLWKEREITLVQINGEEEVERCAEAISPVKKVNGWTWRVERKEMSHKEPVVAKESRIRLIRVTCDKL